MIIGTNHRVGHLDIAPETAPYALFVNDSSIKRIKHVKNLGLIGDENLRWEHHINYISQKIKRNVSILKRMSKVLPTESLCMLYKTLIGPHFRYCSIILGNCGEILKDKLQTLQNRDAMIITRTPYEVANHFALLKHSKCLDVRNIINLDMDIFMYKAMNQLVPGQISEMFTCLSNTVFLSNQVNGKLKSFYSRKSSHGRTKIIRGMLALSFGMKFHMKSEMLIH